MAYFPIDLSSPKIKNMKPGTWIPLTFDAKVVPGRPDLSQGEVLYLSKKPGARPQVVSARRLASWLRIAEIGKKVHQLAQSTRKDKAEEKEVVEVAAANNPRRADPQDQACALCGEITRSTRTVPLQATREGQRLVAHVECIRTLA